MSPGPIKPYTVAVYAVGGEMRMLLAVGTEKLKKNLEDKANNVGAERDGDWYALPTESAGNSMISLTKEMGGFVYNLPIV